MGVKYRYGQAGLESLAKQAGEAQAAQVQLDRQWKKDMAEMEYKFRLAAEERSRLWDLEKMEIASRNDFMRSEQKRVQEQDEFDAKIKQLEDMGPSGTGQISQADVDKYVLDATLANAGIQTIAEREQRAAALEARQDPVKEAIAQALAGKEPTVQPAETPAVKPFVERTAVEKARAGIVPLADAAPKDIPMKDGEFIVYSPEGVQGTIKPEEFEQYAAQNFFTKVDKPTLWERLWKPEEELAPAWGWTPSGIIKEKRIEKETPLSPADKIRFAKWEQVWKKARRERGIQWEGFNLPEFIMEGGKYGLKPLTDAQFRRLFANLKRTE